MHAAMYRALYRIRRVEEEVARIYPTDKIKSPVHLSIGQEAASVAVCMALEPDDVTFGSYRGHALYLAKGGSLPGMIAELYGKATGCAKGKAGSMHLIDVSAGAFGASAVVGTTIPHAVGFSYARRVLGKPTIVASFFGDGAVEEGAFHESLNLAMLHRLPVLFVCENNFYAIHSPRRRRQGFESIAALAAAYGMPTATIEDGDPYRIHEAARRAVDSMRQTGRGPWFLECCAYRWLEHVGPNEDFDAGYRDRSERREWEERDPVKVVGGHLDANARRAIETEVEVEIARAFAFAEESPFPSDAELFTDMY